MKKIYFFDLDGTVTNEEILPKIAERFNFKKKMVKLTRAAMNGDVSFESSFRYRHKLLSKFNLGDITKVVNKVSLNKKIVNFINQNPNQCKIITGNLDKWILPIKAKIKCEFFTSISSSEGINLKYIMNKGEILKKFKNNRRIFIGDGYNDVTAFRNCEIKIAFGKIHSPPDILLNMSDYYLMDETKLCLLLEQL
tara:strand:+ start:403 stop:987 length:585 start_codon:yes stop_codon:yes gene_type:complete